MVGNKSAALAKLRAMDYNVPAGFCVTIPALVDGASGWKDDVGAALRHLAPPWVARSSSTAEDSEGLAFPGLFRTVLDLADARSVLEAVETVRASLNAHAVAVYASGNGVDPSSVQMAVLVQSLISASSAGVAFSRHPVTGAREVIIEANYGLGETVVDGSVTPDSVTVGLDQAITARRLGSKREKLVATTSHARIRRLATSALERSNHVLSDPQSLEIANVVRRLEVDCGRPVDIEWAFDGEELHILQSRPITTGPDARSPE